MRIEGPTLRPSAVAAAIEALIELLAAGEYERACELGGPGWTPVLIQQSIDGYRVGARVTATGSTEGGDYQLFGLFFRDHRRTGFDGDAVVNLFLDGKCSDLAATFAIRKEDGSWVVELSSIHTV
jgi:hypothetical protein